MQRLSPEYRAVDSAIAAYIHKHIDEEVHKNIEDVIFFSSYTIGTSVFRKATNKLKKKLREKDFSELFLWDDEAQLLIQTYHLSIDRSDEEAYHYLLVSLMKAQIKINEAILFHFSSLHKKAHNFDYFERRIEQIHSLLFDTVEVSHG